METTADVARYIPLNWFLHLKEFLVAAGQSSICIQSQWCPKVEREHDSLLMDKIATLDLPKRVIRTCNNWRLYFQVLTLSDITTADGRYIQDCYWKRTEVETAQTTSQRQSRLAWPIQTCPDLSTFSSWKKCLNLAFNLRNKQQLPIPLGDWTTAPAQSANDWKYYLNPYTRKLYHRQEDESYTVHYSVSQPTDRFSSTQKFDTVPDDTIIDLPQCAYPVSPIEEYHTLRFRQTQCTCSWAFSGNKPQPIDFEEHLTTLPEWKQQLLLHWESVPVNQLSAFFMTTSEILVASDGGFNQEQGTGSFGAVIADNYKTYAKVFGSAPGEPDLHCSFRSEMYGLLGVCALLNEITTFHHFNGHTNSTQLIFYLDSQSTIDRITKHRWNPIPLKDMTSADIDVELQILQELRELEDKGYKIPVFHHVKAHQDRKIAYAELSREAQLNVDADRLASKFPETDFIRQVYSPPTAVQVSLVIGTKVITSKYKECLRHAMHAPALQDYIQKKWDWSDTTFHDVWWKAHETALKRLSHSDGQKIQKFNYNHLPTNRRLSKFHLHITNMCPCCNADEELDDHVVWCNSGDRLAAKQLWEKDVYHFLSEQHTPPVVRTAMMLGFHHWIYRKPIPSLLQYIPTASLELQTAYNAQTHIGWNHLVRGRISIHWQNIITQHLSPRSWDDPEETSSHQKRKKATIARVRTSVEWASQFIVSLWHGVLILWDLRNRSIHGSRGQCQSSAEKFRLLQEAKSILENSKDHQEHFEIEWFKKPIEELEKYSVISLKAWVRNARMMVKLHRLEIRKTIITINNEGGNFLNVNSNVSTGHNGGKEGNVDRS